MKLLLAQIFSQTRYLGFSIVALFILSGGAICVTAQEREPRPGVPWEGPMSDSQRQPKSDHTLIQSAQMLPATGVTGQWVDSYDYHWTLTENASGGITGFVVGCTAFGTVTGQSNGNSFTLLVNDSPCLDYVYNVTFVTPDVASGTWYNLCNGSPCGGSTVIMTRIGSQTLKAGMGSGPSDASTVSRSVGSSQVAATFPLGAKFFLQLTKSTGVGITSSFDLGNASITPTGSEPALFPANVLIQFDPDTTGDMKFFRAVHLGTQLVTITPADTSISPVSVLVTVNNPSSLGSSSSEFDAALINLAHERGIPPQYLKGQVAQESRFDRKAYRYEPLSVDLQFISSGQNLRTQSPYSLYRLQTSDNLAQGSSILSDDVSPRSRYNILDNGVIRSISESDSLVSAENIYNTNDGTQNWSKNSPRRARQVSANPRLLRFTAQTSLASSYGLLQILYSTALAPMGWAGINGAKNPSYLFDTESNIENGGGSLKIGSGYLRRIFSRANPNISSFSTPVEFEKAFINAFNMYNRGTIVGDYGPAVISRSTAFAPLPSTPIF